MSDPYAKLTPELLLSLATHLKEDLYSVIPSDGFSPHLEVEEGKLKVCYEAPGGWNDSLEVDPQELLDSLSWNYRLRTGEDPEVPPIGCPLCDRDKCSGKCDIYG